MEGSLGHQHLWWTSVDSRKESWENDTEKKNAGVKECKFRGTFEHQMQKNLPRNNLNQEVSWFPLIKFWDSEVFYDRDQMTCVVGMLPSSPKPAFNIL